MISIFMATALAAAEPTLEDVRLGLMAYLSQFHSIRAVYHLNILKEPPRPKIDKDSPVVSEKALDRLKFYEKNGEVVYLLNRREWIEQKPWLFVSQTRKMQYPTTGEIVEDSSKDFYYETGFAQVLDKANTVRVSAGAIQNKHAECPLVPIGACLPGGRPTSFIDVLREGGITWEKGQLDSAKGIYWIRLQPHDNSGLTKGAGKFFGDGRHVVVSVDAAKGYIPMSWRLVDPRYPDFPTLRCKNLDWRIVKDEISGASILFPFKILNGQEDYNLWETVFDLVEINSRYEKSQFMPKLKPGQILLKDNEISPSKSLVGGSKQLQKVVEKHTAHSRRLIETMDNQAIHSPPNTGWIFQSILNGLGTFCFIIAFALWRRSRIKMKSI